MKTSLTGILLNKINYSENSLILKFYTKEKGVLSFIFQGGKKKKGNILIPLSITELACYKRSDSSLGKISSIHASYVFQDILYNPIKSGLAFFLSEILSQTLKNEEQDLQIFSFLESEIIWLDQTEELTNYPLYFLLELSKYLGFYPQQEVENPNYFDLEEGEFTIGKPIGHKYIYDESIQYISNLIDTTKEDLLSQQIPKKIRKLATRNLLNYYHFHLDGFKEVKTLEVMEEILY